MVAHAQLQLLVSSLARRHSVIAWQASWEHIVAGAPPVAFGSQIPLYISCLALSTLLLLQCYMKLALWFSYICACCSHFILELCCCDWPMRYAVTTGIHKPAFWYSALLFWLLVLQAYPDWSPLCRLLSSSAGTDSCLLIPQVGGFGAPFPQVLGSIVNIPLH